MPPEFQSLEGQSLVALFGWILVVEIFVFSVKTVVVLEAILEEKIGHFMETADTRHNILHLARTQKNCVQLEVYLYIHVENIYTTPTYLSILFRVSRKYQHSQSPAKTLLY